MTVDDNKALALRFCEALDTGTPGMRILAPAAQRIPGVSGEQSGSVARSALVFLVVN